MAENEANTIMGTVNDEDYRRVLRNNEKKITKLINPNYLLPVLRANGLLTKSELQQLEDMPMLQNEANRKAQLFQILLGKEEGNTCTLNSFIKALQEEGEHMGHKSLAIQLLSELSNLKTVPPVPPRKMTLYHAHTLPRHDQLSSETEWHTSLTTTTRSFSEPEVSSNQLQDRTSSSVTDLETEHTDSQEHLLDGVHQLKQMGKKLETNLASQKNIMQRVNYLAKVIVDMQEKMSGMCQLLSELLDNNPENPSFYTNVGQRSRKMEHLHLHCSKDNEYVGDPSSAHADTDSFTSDTHKIKQPRSSDEYDYATAMHGSVRRYMPLSNTNRDSSDEPYYHIGTIEQQTRQQVELVEEEKLANGKNGEVWLAVDKKRGSKVIIKKLFSKEIFMQEKNALAQIIHPNVIRLINFSAAKPPVLIFEYAENGNLLNCLKCSASTFSGSKLLAISAGVACGMLELEKHGIIHCDVKAKSILIDSHFVCKVASFSKAQCLKPGESSFVPPSNVSVNLPIKWAAPEILSKRKFSIKSDVWAFAVLLSEVFSQGNTPYPNMDNTVVKSAVQKGIKMAQPSGCPNEVYEVMQCCFELHAKNRPTFAVVYQQLNELYCKDPMSEANINGSDHEYEDL